MNNQLIENVIISNNEKCPELVYENSLLDRNVANVMSKNLVKILNITQQNSKISDKLRFSILENIRKICQIEPNDHTKIDESLTEVLTEFHYNNCSDRCKIDSETSVKKALDAFLLEKIEDCDLNSNFECKLKPEVMQSLLNLGQNKLFKTLENEVIHWNGKDSKYMCIMKELINKEECFENTKILDSISIKIIPEIEKLLLDLCYNLIINNDSDIDSLLIKNSFLQQLIKVSASSPKCYQICYRILNFILITSNFNVAIRNFISQFVFLVKSNCSSQSFPTLYQTNIHHIVLLLNFNEEDLSQSLREIFIKRAIQYLRLIQNTEEINFVMLLSHFPKWFEIYYSPKYSNVQNVQANFDLVTLS